MSTPEAALGRTDSLDPSKTCKGLTGSGVPCRRPLANPPGPRETDPTKFFCWQHQDQASSAAVPAAHHGHGVGDNVRSSIDTLMGRLGIQDGAPHSAIPYGQSRPRPQRRTIFSLCCCFEIATEEDPQPLKPMPTSRPYQSPAKPSMRTSQTPDSWIPSDLSPEVTKTLTTELAKPLSDKDEPGYIYIFWLTPEEAASTRGPPPTDIASSLLPTPNRPSASRGMSDAIRAAQDFNAAAPKPGQKPGTIRLKIGRANNVHRRMNEWSKQCAHDVTLLRYYPYTPSSGTPDTVMEPGRMVPFVHRVEHLIHVELTEMRLLDLGKCQYCGKEHKEWFEVSAEKEAIHRVDKVIRKWVQWADNQKSKGGRR